MFHYEKAASISPENIVFQKNLADFYFVKKGEIQKALELYLNVLTTYPEDLESLMNIGYVCLSLNMTKDAKVFFNKVLELEPWNLEAGEQLDKIDQIKISGPEIKTEEMYYQEAKQHVDSGDIDLAIDKLTELLNEYPDSAIAHNDLGVLYYRKKDKNKALFHYQQAEKLMPDNTTFKKNLADFYYVELGKIEEALKIYVGVLKLNPEDVETLLITGNICASLQEVEDAKIFYNRVLNIEPFNIEAKDNLEKIDQFCMFDQ